MNSYPAAKTTKLFSKSMYFFFLSGFLFLCSCVCVYLSPSRSDYSCHYVYNKLGSQCVFVSLWGQLASCHVAHPKAEQTLILALVDTGSEVSHLAAASSLAHQPSNHLKSPTHFHPPASAGRIIAPHSDDL